MADNPSGYIPHDTAAKLLGLSPAELTRLAESGAISRVSRNEYQLVAVVRDYIAYIKNEEIQKNLAPKTKDLAVHLDLAERNVRDLIADLGFDPANVTRDSLRVAYIRRLREQASGRYTGSDINLAGERAGLAREQKYLARLKKQKALGEYAPISNLTLALSRVCSQVASKFDSIPVELKRQFPALTADQLNLIRQFLTDSRNLLVVVGAEAIERAADEVVAHVDDYVDVDATN
jgi:phage terminase Nu1 subunit (DNA packaging protein)